MGIPPGRGKGREMRDLGSGDRRGRLKSDMSAGILTPRKVNKSCRTDGKGSTCGHNGRSGSWRNGLNALEQLTGLQVGPYGGARTRLDLLSPEYQKSEVRARRWQSHDEADVVKHAVACILVDGRIRAALGVLRRRLSWAMQRSSERRGPTVGPQSRTLSKCQAFRVESGDTPTVLRQAWGVAIAIIPYGIFSMCSRDVPHSLIHVCSIDL